MSKLRIAISGASSFTGCWIGHFLSHSNFEVHALYSRAKTAYNELETKRIEHNQQNCIQHFEVNAIDGSMNEWILKNKPDIWIHHHHWTQDFKTPHFNKEKALGIGLKPLKKIVNSLTNSEAKGIIYSGSFYENLPPSELISDIRPYTDTKLQVQTHLENLCLKAQIPLSKIFIPNAVGPFENLNRLIPTMINTASTQNPLKLSHPSALTALYPVINLGKLYADSALALSKGIPLNVSPVGESHSVLEWAQKISTEFLFQKLNLILDIPGLKLKTMDSLLFDWDKVWEHYAFFELQKFSSNLTTSAAHPQERVTPLPPCP